LPGRHPVDPDRVYLTGISMGGSGTWDFVTRHPGVFAAAVPVTGVGDPARAPVVAKLPIWAFHGTLDAISPVENARTMKRALEAAGSTHFRLSELEGVGHDSWRRAYGQLETFRWLLAQRRGDSP
jgi:predicted peptidase